MPRYRQSIEVAAPPQETFRYVADFTAAPEWDPGIAESRRVDSGPPGVGATFDVVALRRGRRVAYRYQITEYTENERLLLVGQAEKARSIDEITFAPSGEGTLVTYQADLTTRGLSRLAEPFRAGDLRSTVAQALGGLKTALEAGR